MAHPTCHLRWPFLRAERGHNEHRRTWAKITDWGRRGGGRFLTILLAALLLGGAYLLGRSSGKGGPGAKQSQTPPAPPGPPSVTLSPQQIRYAGLQIGTAQQVTLPTRLQTTGVIAANLNGQAEVSSRLAGRIMKVYVNVGQSVKAGQPLLLVSSPDLAQAQAAYQDALVRRAAARVVLARQVGLTRLGAYRAPPLENARVTFQQTQQEVQTDKDDVNTRQAEVAQTQAQVNLTQKTFVRGQALYAAQLISRQSLEQEQADAQQAEAAKRQAETVLRAAVDRQLNAQKRLRVAGRELARQTAIYRQGYLANQQLSDARALYATAAQQTQAAARQVTLYGGDVRHTDGLMAVMAPISGRIGDRAATLGETLAPGTPLMTVLNLKTVVAVLNVYQEDLAGVRLGQTVLIESNTAPGRTFSGAVQVVGATLDAATRTAKVYGLIVNAADTLRPGVYVTGTILGGARENVVAVPQDAVLTLNNQKVVFTLGQKPGVYQATPVQTGAQADGMVQITQGLASGSPFVAKNAFILKSEWYKNSLGG